GPSTVAASAQGAPSSAATPSSGGSAAPAPTATVAAVATAAATPTASASSAPAGPVVPEAQLRRPEGIALDRDGNVWVADYGHDRVIKIAPDGHQLAMVGGRGGGPGEFVGPKGVAIDASSGKVYVADTGNARVQRLSSDGSPDTSWPMPRSRRRRNGSGSPQGVF